MQIDIYIDGEKLTFTTPIVPMLANRKYLEIEAIADEKAKTDENYPSAKEQLEEENEMLAILCDVVFNNQFTVEQLIKGAEKDYVYSKLREAVFGKPKEEKVAMSEGNVVGE